MNENEYIKALKKALSGMDSASRDTVIREIQSHITEAGANGADDLEQRFGTPESLAKDYLDGQPLPTPIAEKAGSFGKNILMVLGGSVLALILLVTGLVLWFSTDDFDFANEESSELTDSDRSWKNAAVTGTPLIKVDQARTVFYWHDAAEIRWSCKGDSSPETDEDNVYNIRHKDCLVYLPKQAVQIEGDQADIVLIHPQSAVNLKLHQGQMRIAEKDSTYDYQVTEKRSQVKGFSANSEATTRITINAVESQLLHYTH